ncbi:hypothetical protein AB0M54_15730 [Actinoplanes sp. NPDC051470]|uniref:hypothetical protein n=1 Tax=Actinoplanes sp. NPDC051470 TaxID=3157224 RepID=UPI00342B3BC6
MRLSRRRDNPVTLASAVAAEPVSLPTRFAEAEKINPYQALVDLHDHAIGRPFPPTRDDALAELTLAAAVVSWWARWQPAMIHAAFRAGADLADISAATALDIDEVVRRWHQWAEVQTGVVVAGHRLLDPDEVRAIRVRIAAEVDL